MLKTTPALRRRLQSIELHGYKSFAGRTVFEFGETITAVVGPNGTGKSNIADAIRWVLGEQAYSLLRGRKTEDMIFSGSEARPRAGMASVSIHFDNADGWLPIDFTEVSIGRRAHRDGQNEYLLNGQKVRLREITELLAGSGLAQRTYTIVGQGLVDSVLSLKAEDRRQLFEEAAGIGLHRSRREESVRRLDKTRRNLERVEDVLREIRPRLRGLERQAKRAEEYQRLREELTEALRSWYGYHWYRQGEALRLARGRVQEATQARESLLTELESAFQDLSETRERLERMRTQYDEVGLGLSQLKERVEAANRKRAVAGARLEWVRERELALAEQVAGGEAAQARLQDRIEKAGETLSTARRERELAEEQLSQAAGSRPSSPEIRLDQAKAKLEAQSAEIVDLERQVARLGAALERVQSIEQEERVVDRLQAAAERGEIAGLIGSLREGLRCDQHHQRAIEAALESYGTGVLFADAAAVDRTLEWLSRVGAAGRLSLVAGRDLRQPALEAPLAEGCLGNALHLVRVPSELQTAADILLGRTLVAADRAAARRLLAELPPDARVVTLAGEIYHASGPVVRLGSRPQEREQQNEEQVAAALDLAHGRLAEAVKKRDELLRGIELASAAPVGGSLEDRVSRARESETHALQLQSQLEEQLAALKVELEELRKKLGAGETETVRLKGDLDLLDTELAELNAKLESKGVQSAELAAKLEAQRSGRSEREVQQEQARSALRAADSAYTQAEVELARRQEEMHTLERRIQDDFGLVSFDHDEDITVQDPLPLKGWVESLPRIVELPTGLDKQVNRLRGQLRRMGPVNGESWDEYQEVKERVEFLSSQLEDLKDAERQLQEVISHLDVLMEREFSQTFHAVAEAFQAYFTRLFGGGSARLALAPGESLEDTGVEIEVRLPGRREQGLAMLSGGERSLTACALIFALLKLSPTPFCVLDEVDAMLDESNVLRFSEILRELAEDTQFLLITHNRQTIQQAEVVYGVSLGRDNASEIIGLRLEEAARELAA